MTSFREKWLAAVEEKNSVLCAGLDPAEFKMGRGEEGLGKFHEKFPWAISYLTAVAPYCAAVKTNIQYWKGKGDMESLAILAECAHQLGLVTIDDSKLADIGSTNDAGLYHAKQKGFDAVTLAPFAGNLREAVGQARERDMGLISMCLMSNPEYEREKNSLIRIREEDIYDPRDVLQIEGSRYVRKYLQLANDASRYSLDGVVIGAPSKKNHLTEAEIKSARFYLHDRMLVLLPGLGAQGGEASAIWKYFDKNNVIIDVGRTLMFPEGSESTPGEQAGAAKRYRDMLNASRK